MKIRCEHNSIRLRIRKSELAQLRNEGCLRTSIHFPDGNEITWELGIADHSPNLQAEFSNHTIRITLPDEAARHWMQSDQVGLEMHLALKQGEQLHLLVEKDFPCKDRPGEDKSDFFEELAETTPPSC
ncbi:MAG TPA: hypothetical protein PKL15_12070 [Saprospiraceae bacterium]|nr:hypothetical protein [Saprospiraceae bacterium]HNM26164.1 hypothetical protein [Saprospiraceae bacterium]